MISFLKFKLGYISLLNKTFLFLSPLIQTRKDLTAYFSRLSSQLLSPPLTSIMSCGRLSINKSSGIILSISQTAISFTAFLYIFREIHLFPSAWNGFLPHLCLRNHSVLLHMDIHSLSVGSHIKTQLSIYHYLRKLFSCKPSPCRGEMCESKGVVLNHT